MFKRVLSLTIASFLVGQVAFAGTNTTRFVNVDITSYEGDQPTEIKLRVPMSLIKAMAPQVRDAVNEAAVTADQQMNMKLIWDEVRKSGPTEFVEILGEDQNVSVATTEEDLKLSVNSDDMGEMKISIPLALGDALFNQEGVFDFDSLLAALDQMEGQELVTIEGDRIDGRIWID